MMIRLISLIILIRDNPIDYVNNDNPKWTAFRTLLRTKKGFY